MILLPNGLRGSQLNPIISLYEDLWKNAVVIYFLLVYMLYLKVFVFLK